MRTSLQDQGARVSQTIIELKNISVEFDGNSVLKNIDLKLYPSESLVLIGPSGQGKTTLLKVLAGLIEPNSGELYFKGKSWATLRTSEKVEALKKMGMLFQKNALFDSMTCGENIAFPLRETTNLSNSEINEKVEFYLNAVGISHAKSLYPDEISGGMQKRLGIARALALKPEIIFYDDPTAGLDPITSKKIIELILALKNENNSTVVAITNDMYRAYQMATKIAFVYGKNIIETGSPEQTKVFKDEKIQQFINGYVEGPLTTLG